MNTPTYRVGQQVAVPCDGVLQVGTVLGAQQVTTGWRYRVMFSSDWWAWVEEPTIVGVQGELPFAG